MPPRNWLDAVLGLRMRPQSNEPSRRRTRTSPVMRVDRDFGELRAVGMHRIFHRLHRHRSVGPRLEGAALRARQDRRVGLVLCRIVGLGEPLILRDHVAGAKPGERTVVAGKLQQRLDQRVRGGSDGGKRACGLRRAARHRAGGKAAVAIFERHLLQRQAEPVGGMLRLNGRGAHAHLVARGRHRGVAVGVQADLRGDAGKAVIGIGGGRDAHADQPFAFAAGAEAPCACSSRSAPRRRHRPSPDGARKTHCRWSGLFPARCGGAARSDRCRAVRRVRRSRSPARRCRRIRRARA